MAIGWMTVLKLVPWGEVIKNAPVVADGAKKLWDSVGRKPAPTETTAAAGAGTDLAPTAADTAPALQARLAEAEASVTQLHEQMQASSELIKALAEQNAELVRRVEMHRVRMGWLIGLLVVFGAIAGLNLAVTLSAGG
jgi:hypothetical protein